MEEVRKEGVNLYYKDDKITVTGDTFKLEGDLPVNELTKIYMGNKGRTVATLTIEHQEAATPSQPETKVEEEKPLPRKVTINTIIDELADKGLTEYEIMNTELTIV